MRLNPIDQNDPDLENAVLYQAILKTLEYLDEFGAIGLTKSGAFNRKFVHWAADNFDWPEYSREEMFRVNKVLNEQDYPPAGDVHDLLKHLRLGRHYKGQFVLTKAGKKFAGNPDGLFNLVAPAYIFECEHFYGWGFDEDRLSQINWDIILNIANVEAENGVTVAALVKTFYGLEPTEDEPYWSDFSKECSNLHYGALKPLARIGLLHGIPAERLKIQNTQYVKTQLWRKFLRLDTDRHLRPRVVH